MVGLVSVAGKSFASDALRYEKRAVTYEDLEQIADADESFALSSDGRTIAFEQNGDIYLKETSGRTAAIKIGSGSLPKWSPNGLRLAYYSSGTGSLQLWNYVLADRAARPVTSLPTGISADPRIWLLVGAGALRYDWSPDSSKLIFVSRDQS